MPDAHDDHGGHGGHRAETPSLDTLAVEERFLEEWRGGLRPRLSVYLRRYPRRRATLTALVAALPPDADAVAAPEPPTESFPERLWSGAGMQRALADIFGPAPVERDTPHVAEERTEYHTTRDKGSRDE